MIGTDLALVEQRAGRTYLDTLAAAGATGRSPLFMQVRNHDRIDAATHHVPHMRAFNLGANAYATRAQMQRL